MRLTGEFLIDEALSEQAPWIAGTKISVGLVERCLRQKDLAGLLRRHPELELVQVIDDQGVAFRIQARGR